MTFDGLTESEHEDLCRRCGMSCHFAVPVNGLPVVVDDLHCRYLAKQPDQTFICTVYPDRHRLAPWCHTAKEALDAGMLAQDCLYTRFKRGYRGKTRLHRRLMERVSPAIRAHVLAEGIPYGGSAAGLLRFLDKSGGGDWKVVESNDGTRLMAVPADQIRETSPGKDAT